jgi:guanylate kinase
MLGSTYVVARSADGIGAISPSLYNVVMDQNSVPGAYQASPAALDRLRQVALAGVVGPSGAGKTTLVEAAVAQDPQLHLVISETSRLPRPGERDGVDYHFRSRKHMLQRIARREYAQLPPNITGDLYATAPENYTASGIAILAIWADAIPNFRILPFKTFHTVFITPPTFAAWQFRFGARNRAAQRLAEARRSFAFGLHDPETVVLINDDIADATERFLHYMHGRPLTPELMSEQRHGRACIRAILAELQ